MEALSYQLPIPIPWDADYLGPKAVERGECITLVDARNGFNELSCLAMLQTVRHRYPVGARFTLNFYRHESLLVVSRSLAVCTLLNIIEGIKQVEPLLIVLYGLAFLPLSESLRRGSSIHSKTTMRPCWCPWSGMLGSSM